MEIFGNSRKTGQVHVNGKWAKRSQTPQNEDQKKVSFFGHEKIMVWSILNNLTAM
jgi:ribosomal 50S subunit-recycling heat shock protein